MICVDVLFFFFKASLQWHKPKFRRRVYLELPVFSRGFCEMLTMLNNESFSFCNTSIEDEFRSLSLRREAAL